LVTSAVLSLIIGTALPTPANEPGATGVRDAAATRARAELPARVSVGSQGASVDRRVTRALERGGAAEALLILDGDMALARPGDGFGGRLAGAPAIGRARIP